MLQKIIISLLLSSLLACTTAEAPSKDKATERNSTEIALRQLHDEALTTSPAYEQLRYLCKHIGARLSGSDNAAKAVTYTKSIFDSMDLDSVYLQPVMVPHWERGATAFCQIQQGKELTITALGGSVGTNGKLEGDVITVTSLDELDNLTEKEALAFKDKIVFVTQPMNPKLINTFEAYGGCSPIRVYGANKAAKVGAKAFLLRSLSLKEDEHAHTGVMIYDENTPKIPAAALSTASASYLERLIQDKKNKNESIKITLELSCQILPDVQSYNVIGEIRGSEKPNEIIVVGGHLDSWDLGEGAHDDGTGVMQSIEVLRLLKKMQPKRTIRAVLFMNEENGARGAKEYGKWAKERQKTHQEIHIAALESDSGGFTPRGFRVQDSTQLAYIQTWKPYFEPYNLHKIEYGFGGVDIRPLGELGTLLMGLEPDSQRYFDHHHAETDVFEAVHEREFLLGAAAMASLVYLVSENGIEAQTSVEK